MDWLRETTLLEQPLTRWLIAVGLAAGAMVALMAFKKVVLSRISALAAKTKTKADDVFASVLDSTRAWFFAVVALYIGAQALALSGGAETATDTAMTLALLLQLGLWGQTGLRLGVEQWREGRADTASAATAAAGVAFIARLALWSLLFVLVLANLGVEISALIAGLGVGGIAAALAVQSVLGDLFASLSIYFDRPFDIGDFIIVDDLMGTVSQVGMRSTRVRSLSGELLVFPNADLAKSRIKNYKRMQARRASASGPRDEDADEDRGRGERAGGHGSAPAWAT